MGLSICRSQVGGSQLLLLLGRLPHALRCGEFGPAATSAPPRMMACPALIKSAPYGRVGSHSA
jgi:hypothetical protein